MFGCSLICYKNNGDIHTRQMYMYGWFRVGTVLLGSEEHHSVLMKLLSEFNVCICEIFYGNVYKIVTICILNRTIVKFVAVRIEK